jgi:site-specific recombinase XerD
MIGMTRALDSLAGQQTIEWDVKGLDRAKLVRRFGAKAGIEKRGHPHGLRHSMSHDLMMEGVPVPIIQKQLGHASLATTQRYLDHLAPRDLVETMQRREFEV